MPPTVWKSPPSGTATNASPPAPIRSKSRSPLISRRSSNWPAVADVSVPSTSILSGVCVEPECVAAMSPEPASSTRFPPVWIWSVGAVPALRMSCAVVRLASVPALTKPMLRSGCVLWTKTAPPVEVALNVPVAPTKSGASCLTSMPVSVTPLGIDGVLVKLKRTVCPRPSTPTIATSPGAAASASAAACSSVRWPFVRSLREMKTGAASRPMLPVACRVTFRPKTFGLAGGTGVPADGDSAVRFTKYRSSSVVHSARSVRSVSCAVVAS